MTALRAVAAAALLLAGAASTALAQEGDPLEAKYAEKKAAAWFTSGGWSEDWEGVRARAKETGRPILAYFTRSHSP